MSALGQKQTFAAAKRHVRFAPNSGHMQRTSDVRLVPEADTWSVGFAHRLWVLRRLSCGRASRRLPKLRGRRLPIKRVIAWTVLIQVLNAARPPPRRSADGRLAPTTSRNTGLQNARTIRRGGCKIACERSGRRSARAPRRSPRRTG